MTVKNFLISKVFFKQVVIALVIMVIIIFGILQWLSYTTNHGQEIPVPNLTKMNVEKAGEVLEDLDLDYMILDTVDYRPNFPPYSIVQQDPLPNVTVKENRKIYIKVNSKGYATVAIPDLVQKTYRASLPILKSLGLEEGKKTYVPYLAKDIVLEMKQNGKILKKGDKVLKASKIDLVLGDGKVGYEETETTTGQTENAGESTDE